MRAVESLKRIVEASFEISRASEGLKEPAGTQAVLLSLHQAAVIAVQDFQCHWDQQFPITIDALYKALGPIRRMVERGQKGEAEEDVATSAEDNDTEGVTDAEHASKGQTYQEEREEQDGNGEVNATASGAGTKDDAKVNAAKNSGKPPVTILEDSTEPNGDIVWDSSGEYAGEDLQMSETGAGSDAEIMKPGKKGPKGKKRRLSSLESPPTTPPRTKTRSQTALVKRRHAEEGSSKEESSGEEWDQDRKRRALIKQRAMPPAKASVRTSSRKRNDTSEHPQRTATSMDVDDPLPRSRNSLSAGGKPRKSTKPATDAHSPRSSSAPQQKPTPVNRLYKPFLEAMGMEDD